MVAITSVCGTGLCSDTVTNVQVNRVFNGPFVPNRQNEPSLAQNPTNPLNLIAGANDDIGEPPCTDTTPSKCLEPAGISSSGFYASFDGGRTWPCQGLIDLSSFSEYAEGDPWQTFDSQGNAYYGTLAIPNAAPAGPADFFVAKSTDGGCTYPTAAKVSGAAPPIDDDKPAVAADANPASPFRDNVYATWTTFLFGKPKHVQIVFSRSTDGGRTWTNPRPISPAFPQFSVKGVPAREAPTVKVGPDGTVYIAWVAAADPRLTHGTVQMAISHDGGQTFPGHNITVATILDSLINPLPGSSFLSAGRIFPSLTVAPDGTLYVAASVYIVTSPTTGHGVVLLTKSRDGGQTWAVPVVAGDVSGRSAFFASLTADPAGNVDLVFLALDDVPFGTAPGAGVVHYDAYFAQSTDGGSTFSEPVKISTATSDPDGSSTSTTTRSLGLNEQFVGDYITAVADSRGGQVFAAWTDARNATPCAAVDAFRAGTAGAPNVISQCPMTFGNTDIFLGTVSY